MKIQRVIILIFVVILFGFVEPKAKAQCSCRIAEENEVGHGANEIIEMEPQERKELFGTVKYNYGSYVEEAIVEVFELNDPDEDVYNAANTNRREVACVTTKDGKYCFSDLVFGWHVVRIGTLQEGKGFNYFFVKVKIDPYRLKKDKPLRINLSVGT